MKLLFHKQFEKQLKKLSPKDLEVTKERLKMFLADPYDPRLRNHAIKGKYSGYRSIDIRGDLRALYKRGGEAVIFVFLGSHSRLYK